MTYDKSNLPEHLRDVFPPAEKVAPASLNWILPAFGRVIIEPFGEQNMTDSGLYVVRDRSRNEQATVGIVVEASAPYVSAPDDDDELSPSGPRYAKGTIVVFGKYSGTQLQIGRNGKTLIIMNESDILGELVERDLAPQPVDETSKERIPLADRARNEPDGYGEKKSPFDAAEYN